MFRVQLPSVLIGISFSHPTVVEKYLMGHTSDGTAVYAPPTEVRTTHCRVSELELEEDGKTVKTETLLIEGEARCHPGDRFNRAIGRKFALERAMILAEEKDLLTHSERATIWQSMRKQDKRLASVGASIRKHTR